MRLFSGLDIGREGLMAHGIAMNAVGDNVANSSTVGYKAQRAEFADLVAESIGSLYGSPVSVGNGSLIDTVSLVLTGGPIEDTGRDLDAAIEGNGFFVVKDQAGAIFYTRAGNFVTDPEGNLSTTDGDTVLGFTAESPEQPVPILLSGADGSAVATTSVTVTGNLNSSAPITTTVPNNPASFDELSGTAEFVATIPVIDSLGKSREIQVYFFHTAGLTWQAAAYATPEETGGTGTAPVSISTPVTLTMNDTGVQTTSTPLAVSATWGTGGTSSFAIDMAAFTGYSTGSTLDSVVANGRQAGEVVGTRFAEDGTVYAVLDNNTEFAYGTLALARFKNPYGIDRAGDNKFAEADDSGAAEYFAPKTNGMGAISPAALEGSNVDLATQFIDLIKYQRGYQANSKVIQTASEMITTTIQVA